MRFDLDLNDADAHIGQIRDALSEPSSMEQISLEVCDRLVEAAIEQESVRAEAWSRLLRGDVLINEPDYRRAAADIAHANSLFRETHDAEGEVFSLWRQGNLLLMNGAIERVREVLDRGIELSRLHGFRSLEGILLANVAFTWGSLGEAEPYRELTEQALAIFEELGLQDRYIFTLCNLAGALTRLDRLDEAEAAYNQVRAAITDHDNPRLWAFTLGGRGEIAFLRGDPALGRKLLDEAFTFLHDRGFEYDALRQRVLLGKALSETDDTASAAICFRDIAKRARKAEFSAIRLEALEALAEVLASSDDFHAAYLALREAWELREETIREESSRRFAMLRDTETATALAHDRIRAREMAQVNQRLREILDERDELNAQLEIAARTDPLTQLLNRQGFENLAAQAIAQHKSDHHVVLVWMDLDDFKMINDTHGHETGDQILCAVASRLRSVARSGDLICRFGGDEFIILLEDIPKPIIDQVVSRFESAVAEATVNRDELRITVGVSTGYAVLRESEDLENALRRADERMYEMKRSGKPAVSPPA